MAKQRTSSSSLAAGHPSNSSHSAGAVRCEHGSGPSAQGQQVADTSAHPTPSACGAGATAELHPAAHDSRHGFFTRRILDLAYVLVVSLCFPLYWLKFVDWRLCAAEQELLERDPWLIRLPSAAWAQSWPCSGSQLGKLTYVAATPGTFLRSLVWPVCLSELHFLTTFFLCILTGLLMVVHIPTHEYKTHNTWRLAWAMVTKLHIKAVPITVRLLRPSTPWPLAISQNLPTEGAGSLFLALGVALPAPAQVVVVLVDIAQVAIICSMYGDDWPYPMSRATVLVRQVAAGVAAVAASAMLHGGFSGARRRGCARPPTKSCQWEKDAFKEEEGVGPCETNADAGCGGCESAAKRAISPARLAPPAAAEAPTARPGQPHGKAPAAVTNSPAVAAVAASDGSDANADPDARKARLFELCKGLLTGDAAAAAAAAAPRMGEPQFAATGAEFSSAAPAFSYTSVLAVTHVRLKLPDVEPWQLPPGVSGRVAAALTAGGSAGAVAMDVAVRSGCIELHLDLVRSLEAAAAAAAAPSSGLRPDHELGPVPEHQAALAGAVLEAMGLPPGYGSTVRAQIGTHLLTLTPSAPRDGGGEGGNWAVLGTRRMQGHEAPWVRCVEPPAVACAWGEHDGRGGDSEAGAGDGAEHASVLLRLTVCGHAEQLARVHEDHELELLALFEGAFLPVADVRWEQQQHRQLLEAYHAGASLGQGERVLCARVALPAGRSGAVRLVLGRRGTVGHGASLLLVRRREAALAEEVAELQRRAQAAEVTSRLGGIGSGIGSGGGMDCAGPSAGSVARFVEDLGRWLQYRDFWLRDAEVSAAAVKAATKVKLKAESHVSVGSRRPGSGPLARRLGPVATLAGGWSGAGALLRLLSRQPRVLPPSSGNSSLPEAPHATAHLTFLSGPYEDTHSQPHGSCGCASCTAGQECAKDGSAQEGVHSRDGRNGHRDQGVRPNATQRPPLPVQQAHHAVHAQHARQGRLHAQDAPAFHHAPYQESMRVARRALVEFAIEQRCPATAEVLLTAHPIPPPPAVWPTAAATPAAAGDSSGGGAAATAAASTQCQLAQLAEASRTASADRLTLLHRAVRSGDAATVRLVLRAAATPLPAAPAGPSGPTAPADRLCSWGAADAHGLTPLHYLAVLPDGGRLARDVLASDPEALALWDVERPGLPSAASFAQQSVMELDVAALRLEMEPAQAEAKAGRAEEGGADGEEGRDGGAKAHRSWFPRSASLSAASPTHEAGAGCQAAPRGSCLHSWLLLRHAVACSIGLAQALLQRRAHCRAAVLPLVLHAGSVLLAASADPKTRGPTSSTNATTTTPAAAAASASSALRRRHFAWPCGASDGAAWAMQLLALAALVAQSSGPPRGWPLGFAAAAAAAGGADEAGAAAAAGDCGTEAGAGGSGASVMYDALVVLHYVLAVSAAPYSGALCKLLVVQAAELLACVMLGCASLRPRGVQAACAGGAAVVRAGAGCGQVAGRSSDGCAGLLCAGLALVRGVAAQFAQGWVRRVAASTALILFIEVCSRVLPVRGRRNNRLKIQSQERSIAGGQDVVLGSEREAQRLVEAMPRAFKKVLPNSGHALLHEPGGELLPLLEEEGFYVTARVFSSPLRPAADVNAFGTAGPVEVPNEQEVRRYAASWTARMRELSSPVFLSTLPDGTRVEGLAGLPLRRRGHTTPAHQHPEQQHQQHRDLGAGSDERQRAAGSGAGWPEGAAADDAGGGGFGDGPLLFVGNHQLYAFDMSVMVEEVLTQRGILMRGLAHPGLFRGDEDGDGDGNGARAARRVGEAGADRASGQEPAGRGGGSSSGSSGGEGEGGGEGDDGRPPAFMGNMFQTFGAVRVTPTAMFRLLAAGEAVLLYPGGVREGFKRRNEKYELFWPSRSEFVRMAARFNATIIPVSAVGLEDSLSILLDSDELQRSPLLSARAREQFASTPRARVGVAVDESLDETFVPPLIAPAVPSRMYFLFGRPLRTSADMCRDRAACDQLYQAVRAEVEGGISYLLRKREQDPYRDFLRRYVYEQNPPFGPRRTAPTFKL